MGRYSFVGVNPRQTISLRGRKVERSGDGDDPAYELAEGEDILHVLRAELSRYSAAALPGLPRFAGGAVGRMGFRCSWQ